MEDVTPPTTSKDTEMEDTNKAGFNEKTGIMTDGSKVMPKSSIFLEKK